jgi:serine/threonine-protein kinase
MTSVEWREVRNLFERAIELPSNVDAARWVAGEATDPAVAAEVTSLLDHNSRAGAFLNGPAVERVAGLLDEDSRFAPGDAIGSYRIAREIGRGGMGRVYLATDTRLGRDVALKVLAPSLVRDNSQRERLRREARAAAALSHPGICTVYALEEIGADVVIAAEHIEGKSLREEIIAGSRPSSADLLRTLRDLSSAVAAAHARGITHRDLKPENVMRTADGSLKVLDFGLALVDEPAVSEPRVTTPGTIVGTPAYMAPEQINGQPADARTDVFAIGVIGYELATGVHPFEAATAVGVWARILEGEPSPLGTVRSDLTTHLEAVIGRSLRKNPNERFGNAGELLQALTSVEHGPAKAGSGRPFWWRTHLVAVVALYVLASVAGWLVSQWEHGLATAGFVVIALLAMTGGILRGHLLFAERAHDARTFRSELERAGSPLAAVDLVMAAALVVEGLWVSQTWPLRGVLVSSLGLGIGLARQVLERSTTYAAFGENHG